jgi:hypothetical protein
MSFDVVPAGTYSITFSIGTELLANGAIDLAPAHVYEITIFNAVGLVINNPSGAKYKVIVRDPGYIEIEAPFYRRSGACTVYRQRVIC